MPPTHVGNNWYFGWKNNGDAKEQINGGFPSYNSIYIELDTGRMSHFLNGAWTTTSYGTMADSLASSLIVSITKNSLGTTYAKYLPRILQRRANSDRH